MVAPISSEQSQTRPPLLPSSSSEKPSSNNNGVSQPKKPRGRQVSSRYLSPSPSPTTATSSSSSSSSRRFPSPLLSRSTNSPSSSVAAAAKSPFPAKRSVSADRRRPIPEVCSSSAAAKLLVTSSSTTRSLSVSFQGESFSLPVSKTARKPTPERRARLPSPARSSENSKPTPTVATPMAPDHHGHNQHRWPARARLSAASNSLARSVDFGGGFGGSNSSPARASFENGRFSLDLGCCENSVASDTDSVSSGSTREGGVSSRVRAGTPRGLVVSAKFWQETNTRLRRLQDPGSPNSISPRTPAKSARTVMGSPIRGASSSGSGSARPASPGRVWAATTPVRGSVSPSRPRTSFGGGCSGGGGFVGNSAPSILSFSMDVRRGKIGEDRIVEAHMLRLLYNRYLQWRFANARRNSTFMVHKLNAERNLWNAWVTISELRHSVTLKRIKLLLLRQKLKLTSIIKGQITYLEEWAVLDRDHFNSLLGATEALKASTLRLPVGGKTVADIQKLKDAIGSAVDVMQAMGTSICSLTVKAEDMNSLVAELLKVTVKERILLEQSKDFLSKLASMQVKDCSLRTHIIQFNRVPTTRSVTTRV